MANKVEIKDIFNEKDLDIFNKMKGFDFDSLELLKKYMKHVDWEEGSTFVSKINDPHSDIQFTDVEKNVLIALDELNNKQ